MNNLQKNSKKLLSVCSLLLIIAAKITIYSGSLFLMGEPKPPKSLLR